MARYYGFFNGIDYDANFPALMIQSLIPNGVYNNELFVSSGTGMTVRIAPGRAWINGSFYYDDEQNEITIATASATQPRKDIIVMRLEKAAGKMSVEYVKGTAESNPSAPLPNITDALYELQLAQIDVPAGIANITKDNITDTRSDKTLCGITAGFQGLDVAGLTAQAQAKFDAWFNAMKGQLSTDAAGNLQIQVDNKVSLDGYTALANGADLNNILSPGMYGGGFNAASFVNCPTSRKFKLKVSNACDSINNGHGIYVAQELTDTDGITFYRFYSFGTDWSSWKQGVPIGRKINGYDLSVDRTLTAADVGAPKEETGSWTPFIQFATSGGVTSYTNRFGSYVKHGKLVTVRFFIAPSAKTGSGLAIIAGLPFPMKTDGSDVSLSFQIAYYTGLTKSGTGLFVSPYGNNSLVLRDPITTGFSNLSDVAIGTTSTFIAGSFTYETAA